MNNLKKVLDQEVPAALSISYLVERTERSLDWLHELEDKYQKCKLGMKDCSLLQQRKRILSDVIAMYISTLVDTRKNTNSLVNTYPSEGLVKEFKNLSIVKKCKLNRNNRSAHESKKYGNFLYPNEILDANLKSWLSNIRLFIALNSGRNKNT